MPSSAARSDRLPRHVRGPASRGRGLERRARRRAFAASSSASDCATSRDATSRARPRRPRRTRWTRSRRPRPRSRATPSTSRRRRAPGPLRTRSRSSTSHSTSSADSLFASSRVRTTSSSGVSLLTIRARARRDDVVHTGERLRPRACGAAGMIPSRVAIRCTGRCRSSQASLWTRAAISAPTPPVSVPSSTVTSEPVRPTDSSTGSRSSGSNRLERDDLGEHLVLDDQLAAASSTIGQHPAVRDDRRRRRPAKPFPEKDSAG